jgi:RNA polymerase sigma-70 factor (ECF subfamily)
MQPEEPAGDAELMALSAHGDRGAFAEVVVRHQAAVFRFTRALAVDVSAAEDALQETFLAAWRSASTYRAASSVRNWLLVIARNAVYRQHRRRVDEPDDNEPLAALGEDAGWGSDETPESLAIRQESRMLFARALDALPPADREILVLRDIEGLSGEETSAMLSLTLPAMKTRLHRARLRLAAEVRRAHDGTA